MVFAIRLGFSSLAWHSPVRSQSSFPKIIACVPGSKSAGPPLLKTRLARLKPAQTIGIYFCSSKRRVSIEQAQRIISQLPREAERIGVFMDAGAMKIRQVLSEVGLTGIQMHGEADFPAEVYSYCRRTGATDCGR